MLEELLMLLPLPAWGLNPGQPEQWNAPARVWLSPSASGGADLSLLSYFHPEGDRERFQERIIAPPPVSPSVEVYRLKTPEGEWTSVVGILLPFPGDEAASLLFTVFPARRDFLPWASLFLDPLPWALAALDRGTRRVLFSNRVFREAFPRIFKEGQDPLVTLGLPESWLTDNKSPNLQEGCNLELPTPVGEERPESSGSLKAGAFYLKITEIEQRPVLFVFSSPGKSPDPQRLPMGYSLTSFHAPYTRDPTLMMTLIHREWKRYQRYGHPAALLLVESDQFDHHREETDLFTAERILQAMEHFLLQRTREADIVGRFGGEQFVILMPETNLEEAEGVALRLQQAFQHHPFRIQGKEYLSTISIGLALTGETTNDVDAFIQSAHLALFWAKERGGNRVVVFDTEADLLYSGRSLIAWRRILTESIEENRFQGYFQLVYDAKNLQPAAAEILLRLSLPGEVVANAQDFLPLAIRFGYGWALDQWVAAHIPAWSSRIMEHCQVPLVTWNVRTHSLQARSFLPCLQYFLADRPLIPHLGMEFSLARFPWMLSATLPPLHRLKRQGFKLILDDFGSGLLDPMGLKQLPMDMLKVDGRLIQRILHDRRTSLTVRALHQWVHDLGVPTVAEWVEDLKVLEAVQAMGFDYVQGYRLHAPEPIP